MILNFNKTPISSFKNLLGCYGTKEFRSPMRSTVPLLSLLEDGSDVMSGLFDCLGFSSDSEVHLEFKVPSPKGRGIPSHTDAMIIDNSQALAIEAKWTEPRYDTVGTWLTLGSNPKNRQAVMEGWLELLQPYATRQLKLDDFSDVVYQMVHRAASACAASQSPKLLYLQFTPLPNGVTPDSRLLLDDLHCLHNLLGSPHNFPFYLAEMEIKPTNDYKAIAGLPKGVLETANQVMTALESEPLFDFALSRLHHIAKKISTQSFQDL